jgi:hypothetical protein
VALCAASSKVNVSIELFAEQFTAVVACEGIKTLVHNLNMLSEVCPLRKCFSTALVLAQKRRVLGVRAHMVHELCVVEDDAMAVITVLALVDLQAAVVVLEPLELVDYKCVCRRYMVYIGCDGGKIESISCDCPHSPLRESRVRELTDPLQYAQKESGENLGHRSIVWAVEKARASLVCVKVDLRLKAECLSMTFLQRVH